MKKRDLFLFTGIMLLLVSTLVANERLPKDVKWQTNDSTPLFASSLAQKGGTYRSYLVTFPLTIRTVGPDSNMGIRGAILGNQMDLVDIHPNTEEIIPSLATHWAYGKDKRTMYFKINKRARWSDGVPVTADDFLFTLEFMRSKNIIAPWYNNYYTNEIEKVIKFDDHTIAVVASKVLPDLFMRVGISPTPKHFYKTIPKDFVRRYNWKVVPNTGPYQISSIKKGKRITFKRKKEWWAKDLRYNRGRYNVDKVTFKVIREETAAFEYFKKNKIDAFGLNLPVYWHKKAKNIDIYKKGYVIKLWFYNNKPRSAYGFYLNQDKEIFKDRNVRYAFAHSIHMKKLLREVLRGDFSRLHSESIGFGPYTNKAIRARTFDVDKVSSLMTRSGWKRGKDGIWWKGGNRFSVSLLYGYKEYSQWLVVLKEEAKKAGLELKLRLLDGSAMLKMASENKHDVALMGLSGGLRPRYWGTYHSINAHKPQSNNLTNTDDKELDKMIERYRKTTEIDKRTKLAKRIQEKLHEIGAFVPTFTRDYFRVIYWRWWKFPTVPATKLSSSLFDPFGTAIFWLDRAEKRKTEKAMKTGVTFKPQTIVDKTFKEEG